MLAALKGVSFYGAGAVPSERPVSRGGGEAIVSAGLCAGVGESGPIVPFRSQTLLGCPLQAVAAAGARTYAVRAHA
jgi:hypothetical protein